ncbi:MAG: energy transducer TonB [Bacteroidota bacterium]|nr:energy transducer TonB [Bacteroidota bacterium]MDP3145093.1 energy transducer TonB [Bacteroidota bacterium]MDP3556132.1 energy transducer TonB [Bacteroidota bacterium]
MFKKYFLLLILAIGTTSFAQTSSTSPEYEGKVVGGKEQIEQILQTQLTLPKTILTSNFDVEITCFFDIDTAGNAVNIKMEGVTNNVLRNELKRIFNFFKFFKTLNLPNESRPYFLIFKLSTEKYNRYFKQKNKLNFKNPLPADTSFVIYTKADKSPEYYKNGDDGLAELILSKMEYPKLAIEKSVEGTVVIEFVVEANGYLSNIAVKQPVGAGCTEEALRVIKLTRWQPAVVNNKFARYKTQYPITFSLRNINKDNTGANSMGQ